MDVRRYSGSTKWIIFLSSIIAALSSPTESTKLLSRNVAAGHIITLLPETDIHNVHIKGTIDSGGWINVTSDGVIYTTKQLYIPKDEDILYLSFEYNKLNGKFVTRDLTIKFTDVSSHRYLLNTAYYGYICHNSKEGSTIGGLERLNNDLNNIPLDAKVKLLRGDEKLFDLIEQETNSAKHFEIRTQRPTKKERYQYQTVIQVHPESSYMEHAFLHVNVRECGNINLKRVSIPLVHHTHHRRSKRAIREDKVFVVNSLSTGDLFM